MSSDVIDVLKIPTRPAPPPPKTLDVTNTNGAFKRSTTYAIGLAKPPSKPISNRADRYIYQSVPRSRSTSDISGQKRLPPPRPPPPKLPPLPGTPSTLQKPQSIKIKLPGFKSRKKHRDSKPHIHVSTWRASNHPNKAHPLIGSLIDLQSPPHSPNTNNDSSSDDSSVDSFDSDSGGPSSTENQNDYSRAWSGSQVESGFEDDFDRLSTPSSSDPWSDSRSDPFSPQRRSAPLSGKFDISNDDPKMRKPHVLTSQASFKPTVIRPAVPVQIRKPPVSRNKADGTDESPPMPAFPPPPPPPEALDFLTKGPSIPPRPSKPFEPPDEPKETPYCLALYEYSGDHAEDLSFKENEKVLLKRQVNKEWLEGEINGKTGIFPANFVNIVVPLPTADDANHMNNTAVLVTFDYHAQSWDDLDLKEGDIVRVIGRVDDNWLYGECNGKRGQFPSNFVAEHNFDF